MFICPTQQELVQIISATHNQLLLNFHTACIAIHQVIGHAARVEVGYLMLKQSTYQLSILRILMVFRNKCLENVRHSTEDLQSWKSFFFYPRDIFVRQNLCFDNIGITKSQLCFTMHRKLNQRVKQPGNLDWMIPSVTSMNMVYYFNAPHILGQTQRSPCHQFPTGL